MRVLSTFTGIGGFDLAAQRCDMGVVAQSEIEPFCGKVLAHRFPGVPNFGDIRSLHAGDLGAIDLLCGGFPCQDLSVAGKRAGLAWNTDYVTPTLVGGGVTLGAHGKGGNSGGFRTEPDEHLVAAALLDSKAGYRGDLETETFVTHALSAEGHDASEDGTGRGTPLLVCGGSDPILADDLSFPLTTRRADQTAMAWDMAQITSRENRANPKPGDPAPPLNQKGQLSLGVRRLMPVECERLQGFPDAWTCLHDHPQQCDCPDSPRYRVLGNAVAVPVIEWVLDRMATVHFEALAAAA